MKQKADGTEHNFRPFTRARPEDVTIFTNDLALLLRTGARINDALELLSNDADIGRMRSTLFKVTGAILAGESFAEAIAHHPNVFPRIYVALVRIGETSGTLVQVLESLAAERGRAEALGRRLSDTLRYPAFLLFAASGVLIFFLSFVLPQFTSVFRDFNAKLDPTLVAFLKLSDFLRGNAQPLMVGAIVVLSLGWLALRRPEIRGRILGVAIHLPLIRPALSYRRTSLFCRNLSLLLSRGMTLTGSLRILVDIMSTLGSAAVWTEVVDAVRQGGKLSDALLRARVLPPTAVRTLRLGEDTAQLPELAARIAEFYEVKLQRSLDRLVGIAGPVAIIFISTIVGGLIISVMTALLSVNQIIG